MTLAESKRALMVRIPARLRRPGHELGKVIDRQEPGEGRVYLLCVLPWSTIETPARAWLDIDELELVSEEPAGSGS